MAGGRGGQTGGRQTPREARKPKSKEGEVGVDDIEGNSMAAGQWDRDSSASRDGTDTLRPGRAPSTQALGGQGAADTDQQALTTALNNLSSKMSNMQKSITSNHSELKKLIDKKVKTVKDDLNLEIATVTRSVQAIERRLADLKPDFQSDVSIVIRNLSTEENESEAQLMRKVERVVSVGLELPGFEVIAVKRLQGRNNNPGLVKAEFVDVNTKIEVLRAKTKLKSKGEFKHLYLASDEDHAVRVMKNNFTTLLNELGMGGRFRFTGSGRLVPREGDRPDFEQRGPAGPRADRPGAAPGGQPGQVDRDGG